MKSLLPIAHVLLLTLTACVSDPKAHFMLRELDTKQQLDFAQANIILLGEQHDNPVHHKIQQEILERLGEQGRLSSVVFEQIDWTEQGVLSQLTSQNLAGLPEKLQWAKSGWPDYSLYEPLIATAVKYNAKVIAGGLPKNRLELLYKQGYEGAFTAPEVERLQVRKPIDAERTGLLLREIVEGHCKMISDEQAAKMIPIQRARDAALIRGYQNEASIDGVSVFILGSGHARKEFGVPTLLKMTHPKAKVWSVGMQEAGAEPFPQGGFDKIFITERYERPDPCEGMKQHMEKEKVKKDSAEAATPVTAPQAPVAVPAK